MAKTKKIYQRYTPEKHGGRYYVHDCLFPEPLRGVRAVPYETEDACQERCDDLNNSTPDFELAQELKAKAQEVAA